MLEICDHAALPRRPCSSISLLSLCMLNPSALCLWAFNVSHCVHVHGRWLHAPPPRGGLTFQLIQCNLSSINMLLVLFTLLDKSLHNVLIDCFTLDTYLWKRSNDWRSFIRSFIRGEAGISGAAQIFSERITWFNLVMAVCAHVFRVTLFTESAACEEKKTAAELSSIWYRCCVSG